MLDKRYILQPLLHFMLLLAIHDAVASTYVNKDRYLIDSLSFDGVTNVDRAIIDSCMNEYHSATHDTMKLFILGFIAETCYDQEVWTKYNALLFKTVDNALRGGTVQKQLIPYYQKKKAAAINNFGYLEASQGRDMVAIAYFEKSLQIEEYLNDYTAQAYSLNNIGFCHMSKGRYHPALEFYLKSLAVQAQSNDSVIKGYTLNNIAKLYNNQGKVNEALTYFHQSLKLRVELGDESGQAACLNNIGSVLKDQGNKIEAMEHFMESKEIFHRLGHKQAEAYSLSNLGAMYMDNGSYKKARLYFTESLALSQEIGDKHGESTAINNLGLICSHEDNYPLAIKNLLKAIKLEEDIGDIELLGISCNNLGDIYYDLKRYDEALFYTLRGLELSTSVGRASGVQKSSLAAAKIQAAVGDYQAAIKHQKLFIKMSDSLRNEATQKKAQKMEMTFLYEKNRRETEHKNAIQARIEEQALKQRDRLHHSGIFMSIVMLFIIIAMLGVLKLSPKFAEGLVFFSFLVFFEFLLVLTDPYIESWAQGAPAWKLFFNAIIAGFIFPLHGLFERLLRGRILKK